MFTIITFIFFIGALRQNGVVAFIFLTLVIGFVLLDIGHLTGTNILNKIGAVDLIVCALSAWYMIANIILKQFNINVPIGKAWIK